MKSTLQFVASIACAVALSACGGGGGSTPAPLDPNTQPAAYAQIDSLVGAGAVATAGSNLTVNYTGWLYSAKASDSHGAKFDSGSGFKFKLGSGQVIPGWDKGVAGMKVGGKRTLVLTSADGYGANGSGQIPPNAGLVFDVELTAVN
ncbi:FKBP-type peptidyl-prolyl cis-trans isomerase [Janthinobacterium sp.]|uniref:FKBP-type peptidyl-prolyl cis-trans isomerase n=1 Tax=Janthinobacterium sp. TaxID=1871054 RepID=UPI00293D2907|nr:FKBP-type peptidyl-prolyl cis-trans isomerase [Janthinobacterium sp.]